MPDQPPSAELTQTRRERDLYRRLLDLGEQNELEPFLREALALVVEVVGARQGYLEVHDDEDRVGDRPWCIAHGFSAGEVEGIRAAISRGIIAHALPTGQTIVTPSALLDPRFRERDSVRMGRIEAVVCAPIGSDPPLGVLYLQGREQPGAFSEEDRSNAELFSRHLAPLAERELFGHERGAFTGAIARQEGKVAAAERGTLVLDEVAELPLPAQAKLLQLLQSRHYYPLGASKPLHADVRLIAATNADLRA